MEMMTKKQKQIDRITADLELRIANAEAVNRFLWHARETQLKQAERLRKLVMAQAKSRAAGHEESRAAERVEAYAKTLHPFRTPVKGPVPKGLRPISRKARRQHGS
jgi:hypothetical protein